MDLVLTKWIALKGTSVLASCRVEELSSRFPSVMIRDAAGFTCYLSTEREYQISGGYGAAAIYPLGKGGVLGGLWNMLEQINAGMEIDLRKIPIRQETVEICEFFDLNPYYTDSTGALLVAVEDGFGLVSVLEREGIHAAVIGTMAMTVSFIIREKRDTWTVLRKRNWKRCSIRRRLKNERTDIDIFRKKQPY